jgi:hypothetical protein
VAQLVLFNGRVKKKKKKKMMMEVKKLQKTAILGTAYILRKVMM